MLRLCAWMKYCSINANQHLLGNLYQLAILNEQNPLRNLYQLPFSGSHSVKIFSSFSSIVFMPFSVDTSFTHSLPILDQGGGSNTSLTGLYPAEPLCYADPLGRDSCRDLWPRQPFSLYIRV